MGKRKPIVSVLLDICKTLNANSIYNCEIERNKVYIKDVDTGRRFVVSVKREEANE